jgi:hypothetical protein
MQGTGTVIAKSPPSGGGGAERIPPRAKDVNERQPRFVSTEDLFESDRSGDAVPAAIDRCDERAVSEFDLARFSAVDSETHSALRTAPPANLCDGQPRLLERLHSFLVDRGCDPDAFDRELGRQGCDSRDLDASAVWDADRYYGALLAALKAASRGYRFDSNARQRDAEDVREALRAAGKRLEREGRSAAGRALRWLALGFDPVYWSDLDSSEVAPDELERGLAIWEAFVTRATASGGDSREAAGERRVPWSIALALDLARFEFRRLAEEAKQRGTAGSYAGGDILRAALREHHAPNSVRALTVFLAANSAEFNGALSTLDELAADR